MDYRKRMEEGARISTYKAQKTALQNCVYVCTDKENNKFEFIPLDEVILFPNTKEELKLSAYLLSLQNTIKGISAELVKAKQDINTLNDKNKFLANAVDKLAEFVDNQRFL